MALRFFAPPRFIDASATSRASIKEPSPSRGLTTRPLRASPRRPWLSLRRRRMSSCGAETHLLFTCHSAIDASDTSTRRARTLHRAPVVGQGPSGPDWLAIAFGFWSGRALATGTAWAGLCLIHHHQHAILEILAAPGVNVGQPAPKAAPKLSHEARRSSEECVGSHESHRPNYESPRFAMV